jgi:hypothetical protein
MKGSKLFPLVGLGLILCALLMTACSGKIPANGPPALIINTQNPLPTGAEGDHYQEGLSAVGGLQPYTWTIDSGALPPGLTLTTAGVLSGTPPTGTAGTYNFTVRVTDSQSPVKAYQVASLGLTINLPLSFPVSTLQNAVVAVPYAAAVMAMGGLNCEPQQMTPCYTYALAPGSAPLPAGLTLNKDGTITGTPTGPIGTFPFTVQVTDQFPTTATANFSITVTGKIQGSYVFSFNGYNQQGQAFYMVGSFVADGNGNILKGGVFDRNGNDSIGAMTNVAITPGANGSGQCPNPTGPPPSGTGSVYCVGRSGVTNGSNLGTIVIASALGTYSFSVSVSLISDSTFILADPNNPGVWGSGVLKTQGSLSTVSLASNSFAFGLFGIDSSENRYGGAGYFITDANGNVGSGNGEADINDNGTLQSQAPLTGNVTPTVDSTTGRGTATFTIGSTTFDYAFYVVPGKLIFPTLLAVQTDAISSTTPVTLATIVSRGASGGTTTFTNINLTALPGTFTLSAAGTASGGVTVYTGTITSGAANTYTGYSFTVTGFDNPANNGGPWMCTASSATSLTLQNPSGVADTHAATAIRGGGGASGTVFELNAVSTSGGTSVPDVSLGLGNFDGNGNITSYIFDEDKGGTLTTPVQNNYTGTYSVDPNNKSSGRVAVTLNGVTNNPVWYLTASNTGFVVGTDANVTVGTFEPQTAPSAGFSILSLFGDFYGGTSNPVLPSVINQVAADIASPPPPPGTGNGIFDGTYDTNGTSGVMMNQIFMYPDKTGSPGGYCLADGGTTCPNPQQPLSTTGRILIVDNSGNLVNVLYIVSGTAAGATNAATKSVTLSTGGQPSLSVLVH